MGGLKVCSEDPEVPPVILSQLGQLSLHTFEAAMLLRSCGTRKTQAILEVVLEAVLLDTYGHIWECLGDWCQELNQGQILSSSP